MAEIVVFHHALGLTAWVRSFADRLRSAGHTVHTPDLFEGLTFDSIEEGVSWSDAAGGPLEMVERGRAAVASLPADLVFVGFSLGVLPAQSLAQTRLGARGAVLCYAALPLGEWGPSWPAMWPAGVALQVHIAEGDEDEASARALAATVPGAQLFLYPGSAHYFAEQDPHLAEQLVARVLAFLA